MKKIILALTGLLLALGLTGCSNESKICANAYGNSYTYESSDNTCTNPLNGNSYPYPDNPEDYDY